MYYSELGLYNPGYNTTPTDPSDVFPLGLYTSDTACNRIKRRAMRLPEINKPFMDSLKGYFGKHP